MKRSIQIPADILEKYILLVKELLGNIPKDLSGVKTKKELAIYKRFVRLAKSAAKNSKSKELQLLAMERETDILEQLVKIEKMRYERDLKRRGF